MNDDEDAKAYLEHRAMEHRAHYLRTGRRFERLADEALDAAWASAFIGACADEDQGRYPELNDLEAEIRLRNRDVPTHLVRDVMPRVQANIARIMAEGDTEHIERRLEDFYRQWKERGNQQ